MSQHEPPSQIQTSLSREIAAVLAEQAAAQEDLNAAQTKMLHTQRRLAMLVRDLSGFQSPASELIHRAAEAETLRPVGEPALKHSAAKARREEFLNLYANTDVSLRALAQHFSLHPDRPRRMLRDARDAGDERVKQGDARRARGAAPQAATQGETPAAQDEGRPVRDREASDERAALGGGGTPAQLEEFVTVSGAGEAAAIAVDPAPAPDDDLLPVDGLPKREPIIPITKPKREPPLKPAAASTQLPLALEAKAEPALEPEVPVDRIITVQGAWVIGPTGRWFTSLQIGRTLAVLADGQLYGLDRMQKAGGWTDVKFVAAGLTAWTRELKEIGVDLIQLKGIGVRLARREIA